MTKLSWSDLFTELDDPSEAEKLFSLWPRSIRGPVSPMLVTACGDVFFQIRDGSVHMLDVLEGGVRVVAPSQNEFTQLVNSGDWRADNLLPDVVALILERGLERGRHESFAFAPHPVFSGKIDPKCALVMDTYAWHIVCSQLLDKDA